VQGQSPWLKAAKPPEVESFEALVRAYNGEQRGREHKERQVHTAG